MSHDHRQVGRGWWELHSNIWWAQRMLPLAYRIAAKEARGQHFVTAMLIFQNFFPKLLFPIVCQKFSEGIMGGKKSALKRCPTQWYRLLHVAQSQPAWKRKLAPRGYRWLWSSPAAALVYPKCILKAWKIKRWKGSIPPHSVFQKSRLPCFFWYTAGILCASLCWRLGIKQELKVCSQIWSWEAREGPCSHSHPLIDIINKVHRLSVQ